MNDKRPPIPPAEKADILHQTAQLYLASNLPIDYGTGVLYTSVEVHALKYIADHPGRTTTELALDWDITKAAVSQQMKRLEQKGLIYRESVPGDRKKQRYYPSEEGRLLNDKHREYDTAVFGNTLSLLGELCSQEDIETCFRVLECYIQARRKKHYNSHAES